MIAVDTNLLVYAHRGDSTWHTKAAKVIRRLGEGTTLWAIPWPCLHEFYAIVTHPRIYIPASTPDQAMDQIAAWLEAPSLMLLAETEAHWDRLRNLLDKGRIAGPMVHDARIAAICLDHGVAELWSADRDFSRFPGLVLKNPLIA
jgi:uncharacterized protein